MYFYIKLAFDHFFASRYHPEVNYDFALIFPAKRSSHYGTKEASLSLHN